MVLCCQALIKSKHEQSVASLNDQIAKWEKDLREVRADMAREAAERARWLEENPGMAHPDPPAPAATEEYDFDEVLDSSDDDDDISAMDDLGSEYDSESDYEYPDSDEDVRGSVVSSDHDREQDISISSDMDSSDEWVRNVYASGDETESDTDTPTRVAHAGSSAVRRKS